MDRIQRKKLNDAMECRNSRSNDDRLCDLLADIESLKNQRAGGKINNAEYYVRCGALVDRAYILFSGDEIESR